MQNEFPNARNVCYLNTGSEGLLPLRSLRALEEAARQKMTPQVLGDVQYFNLPARCRRLLAQMLHCDPKELALVPSTSFGLGIMALSLPLKSGDEVLLVEHDFPANNFAWEALRQYGIRIKVVPFVPDRDQTSRVLDAINTSTRAVSIGLVHFYTGFRYDLESISKICREREIFLIVDAIQAVGNLQIDLEKTRVDAMAAAAHKWQLSPTGTGFLYIHQETMQKLRPTLNSWMSNKDATSFASTNMFEYQPASTVRRFELGTGAYILLSAYEQSLELLRETKINFIEEHNFKLVSRFRDFFRELEWKVYDFPLPSSIFSVTSPEKYRASYLHQALSKKGIYVAVRENHLRITPHLYNSDQDVERFCSAFKKLL